jgi:hypothetical protein
MKVTLILFFIILSSCSSMKIEQNKYELAYNEITKNSKKTQPFFNDYHSDASGTKIIPKIYKYKGIYKNLVSKKNLIKSKNLKSLSKKYSQSNWRHDKDYKLLMQNEFKNFNGPLDYVYFSEIKNNTLKAQILANPNGKYEMTTAQNFIFVLKNSKIVSVKKWFDSYN